MKDKQPNNAKLQMETALQTMQAQRDAANNQVVQMAAAHAAKVAELEAEIEALKKPSKATK